MRNFILALFAAICLAACGGGSGGGSTTSGVPSGPTSSNPISVSKSNVSLRGIQFNTSNIDSFSVRWTDDAVTEVVAGFPPNSAEPDWLGIELLGSTSPLTLRVFARENNLSSGTYMATLRVVAGNAAGEALGLRDVAVTYTVEPRPKLRANPNGDLEFFAVAGGQSTEVQTVSVTGNGIDYIADVSESWVAFAGTTGQAPSDLEVFVFAQDLDAGMYTGTVTLTDAKLSSNTTSFEVMANIQAELRSDFEGLELEATEGQQDVETVDVMIEGDGVGWTLSGDQDWLTFSQTAGTGLSTVTVGAAIDGLAPGVYNGIVTLTGDDIRFAQQTIYDVSLTIESRMVIVGKTGVALTSTPGLSALSSSVDIIENGDENLPWSASSDQTWLTVTTSGETGGAVTLTADPAGLALDTVHFAEVTIISSSPFIRNTETISVGFWVGQDTPTARDTVSESYAQLLADPIRPYVYMHKNTSQIDVYNVHTAELVRSFTPDIGRAGDMAITDDGASFFVIDDTNVFLKQIDLSTDTEVNSWNMDNGFNYNLIEFGRVKTKPFIFNNNNMVIDVDTGTNLDFTTEIFFGLSGQMDVSQNGTVLCSINEGVSPFSLACTALDYSFLEDRLLLGGTREASGSDIPGVGSNGRDVAVSPDGTRVYTASGAPYFFAGWDVASLNFDQNLPADSFPNNVEFGSDGLLYGGIDSSSSFGSEQVWVYNVAGAEQGTFAAENPLPRQLVVSGDALRIITAQDAFTGLEETPFITVK